MKNVKGKILIGLVAIALAFVAIFSTIAMSKNGIDIFNFKNNAPQQLEANSTQYNLSSTDIIKKGTELLGVPYQFGKKGVNYYNVYDSRNSLNSSNLYSSTTMYENRTQTYQELQANGSILTKYTYGLDCSGFVYYVLTALNCKTTGYTYQNPVPVDTTHWLKTTGKIQRGNNVQNVTVLKQAERVTSTVRYYNKQDGTEIPAGSIVISDVKENGYSNESKCHAWIYLGNFSSVDELKDWLVNVAGVNPSYLERTNLNGQSVIYDDGKGGTHWRLEAAGSVGVRISNVDPDDGSSDNGKVTGNIWAFQVSDDVEITGSYDLGIQKVDSKGNALAGSTFNVTKEDNSEVEMSAVSGRVGYIKTNNPITISSINSNDIYYIEETSAPNGYVKFQNKIKLEVSKILSSNKYVINNVKVYVSNNNNEWVEQERGEGTYQYFNGKLSVDWDASTGNISVTVKDEKVDLALKKTITKVTDNAGVAKDVNKTNQFNVSRDFNESGYFSMARDYGNVGANTNKLASGESTNAVYWMNKTPVEVEVGNKVQYSIKIFNEGEVKAKASKVTDYIPTGLKLSNTTPVQYRHNGNLVTLNAQENPTFGYKYDETYNVLTIVLNGNDESTEYIPAFDGSNLSFDEIIVTCDVVEGATGVLTNVSEISEYKTEAGVITSDIDSTKDNWQAEGNENKLTNSKDSATWRNYSNGKGENAKDGAWHPDFYAQDNGLNNNHGDDDDFDKVIVKRDYKLTLKKVNGDTNAAIDDIQFQVTRNSEFNGQAEDLGTITTENGSKVYTESLSNNANGIISYTFQELENANYVQLNGALKFDMKIKNGEIFSYSLKYGNREYSDMVNSERTYTFTVSGIDLSVKVNINYNTNEATLEIQNKVIPNGDYQIGIRKVSAGDGRAMAGVGFQALKRLNDGESQIEILDATNAQGDTNYVSNTINVNTVGTKDYYEFTETTTLPGYTKLNDPIKVWVYKYTTLEERFAIEKFVIQYGNKSMIIDDRTTENSFIVTQNGVDYEVIASRVNNNGITALRIVVPNAPSQQIPVQITKVSKEDGTQLKGADFEIRKASTNSLLQTTEDNNGTILYTDSVDAETTSVVYDLKERNAPEGYDNIFYGKTIRVSVTLANGAVNTATAKVYDGDTEDTTLSAEVSATVDNGTVKVRISNPETEKIVDLALRKVIVNVDGKDVDSLMGNYDRLTESDMKVSINTLPLKQHTGTNAIIRLNKTPILVQRGSKIKYQIRIYNEGEEIDTTASKIKDYIPSGLKFEKAYYRDETTPLSEGEDYTLEDNTLTIKVLNRKDLIAKYDATNDVLSYDYVTVVCSVKDTAKGILTNVAEISEYKTSEGIVTEDRDSEPANWRNPVDGNISNNSNVNYTENQRWIDYCGKSTNVLEEGVYKNYVGQQDDDDFEKVLVGEVDLVLKKVIINVNDVSTNNLDEQYQRFQDFKINVNTSKMNSDSKVTTAEYYMNKTPIRVKVGDEIKYAIRIYNEGSVDATASEIKDYIPKGLTFVSAKYDNRELALGVDYTINNENVLTINALQDHLIAKYNGNQPAYDYVIITCRVNGEIRGLLTNVAEISKYQTAITELTEDRDSQTIGNGEWQAPQNTNKNTLDGKSGENWAKYGGEHADGAFYDYPGQQDDDDFEKILVTTGYRFELIKYSNETGSAMPGVNFQINGQDYTTDNNGRITLGLVDLVLNEGELGSNDQYTIREVSTHEGYSKIGISTNPNAPQSLSDQFYVFLTRVLRPNDGVELSGGYINFINPRTEGAFLFPNNRTITYYTTDEDGNYVPVTIVVYDDTINIGNYVVVVTVGNNIKDNQYEVKLKKVDEDGNYVDGARFKVSSDNMYRRFETTYTSMGDEIDLGTYKISQRNVEVKDHFFIEEIATNSQFHLLDDKLQLEVSKELTEDGYAVSVSN